MKRAKTNSGQALARTDPQDFPWSPEPHQWAPPTNAVISCDGDTSGWGFTAFLPSAAGLVDFYGPTIVDPSDPLYISAEGHSNNVAELSALFYALCWLREKCYFGNVTIEFDYNYAGLSVQRKLRIRTNLGILLKARSILDDLPFRTKASWRKVAAHEGHYLNERADRLAKLGAAGQFADQLAVARWSS